MYRELSSLAFANPSLLSLLPPATLRPSIKSSFSLPELLPSFARICFLAASISLLGAASAEGVALVPLELPMPPPPSAPLPPAKPPGIGIPSALPSPSACSRLSSRLASCFSFWSFTPNLSRPDKSSTLIEVSNSITNCSRFGGISFNISSRWRWVFTPCSLIL